MESLISQNLTYVLIVSAVMLAITTILFSNSVLPKLGMALCLGMAGYKLFYLQANPWALVFAALSPLPFFFATYQSNLRRPLLIITTAMLIFGSAFLFVDKNGSPTVNLSLVSFISIFCGLFILSGVERYLEARDTRYKNKSAPYVGVIGTALTEVDDIGLIQVEDETLSAHSDQSIPVGSTVRILKFEGRICVVKKLESLTRK